MKKAFDQTVRDVKREVNKKVLKVPRIEQKVRDATSNEAWGPHGSDLADIAQATRNYHEYQMIMAVIWRRINDTGKNWRHVYKALTVLEYLVAHGSERVIEEIREHAYQISTLSDFQYIDSSGTDQGSNVRKKSQALVALVNDKERIQEARQKAAANRDKFRSASASGGMYRPNSSSSPGYGDRYDDDRYGSREEDRNGYGREREWGYRDEDRYGRNDDSYGRVGDRYSSRDFEERYGRDTYRDDNDYRGRSRSNDHYQYDTRSRSSDRDRDRDRALDDDARYSSRGSGARADDLSQDGRKLDRKFSEQNLGAPPSYEEAVSDARSPVQDEKDGETSVASVPKASQPPVSISPSQETTVVGTSAASPVNQNTASFDEFDPRGSFSAAPATVNAAEMDLLGSLSESFSSNSLALIPVASSITTSETDVAANSVSGSTFASIPSGSTTINQPIEDPFGDSPFKASPSTDSSTQPQPHSSATSFHPATNQNFEPQPPQLVASKVETVANFNFEDSFSTVTYSSSTSSSVQLPSTTTPQFLPPNNGTDILANILPPSGPAPPLVAPQTGFPPPTAQFSEPIAANTGSFHPQLGSTAPAPAPITNFGSFPPPYGGGTLIPQSGSLAPVSSQVHTPAAPVPQHNGDGQVGPSNPIASTGSLALVPQQPKDKFETKSTVWADTLSRGLVNLNISGPKINPLADIGIDFDAINRKEKRMEKPSPAPVTSTINMGKAMGSGSGIGRAGASALRPPPNSMLGSGMGMGMGMNQHPMGMGMNQQPMGMGMAMNQQPMGMGTGGYGGMNQQPIGMGMNMGMNNMGGAGQGFQMQPSSGSVGYPMMGPGGYAPQHPYGGGYR